MKCVIAGGTGAIGSRLTAYLLERDPACDIVIPTRSQTRATESQGVRRVQWDARSIGDWATEIDGADVLVNLVGRSVDCIKTPEHCDEILRSRVESTAVLGEAIANANHPPAVWLQMSTAHIYGDPPETVTVTEESAFGYGLAPFVGQAWEQACLDAATPNTRKVLMRTSFVIGKQGGAMARLRPLAKLGLGGQVGHGRQGMSWIHEDDLCKFMHVAMSDSTYDGPYILTAPNPVSNREFMRELRRAVGMPVGLPAMSWMVKFGAPLMLRTDPELALYGRYCVPKRLLDQGFEFAYPKLPEALQSLL